VSLEIHSSPDAHTDPDDHTDPDAHTDPDPAKESPDPRSEACLKLAGPAQVVQDDRQLLPGLQFDSRRGS
jgi:hypothetical protein